MSNKKDLNMAKKKTKQKQNAGWVPPFFSGIVLGAILVSCIYYFGVRNFDPDTEFLKTFPDIENTFPNITFEFPERLQETDPARVGAVTEPEEPQVEPAVPTNAEDVLKQESQDEVVVETTEIDEPTGDETSITGYVLQAGAFADKKRADSFRASLLIDGYNAFTKQTSDVDSVVQFRVIVGPYETIEDSQEDSDRLQGRNISTFVVPMREVSQ